MVVNYSSRKQMQMKKVSFTFAIPWEMIEKFTTQNSIAEMWQSKRISYYNLQMKS